MFTEVVRTLNLLQKNQQNRSQAAALNQLKTIQSGNPQQKRTPKQLQTTNLIERQVYFRNLEDNPVLPATCVRDALDHDSLFRGVNIPKHHLIIRGPISRSCIDDVKLFPEFESSLILIGERTGPQTLAHNGYFAVPARFEFLPLALKS